MGWVAFFENFIQIACLLFAWALVLLAFFILAVQLFVTLIEFKLTTLAGFVLIPFGLFGKTAFMAERVLGNVMSSGIKILVLAVVIGIGSTLFSRFTTGFGGATPTIDEAMAVVLAALSLLALGIFGPGIANGLVTGGPQLGAGAAVGTGLAVGGAALATGGGAMLAARGVGAAASGGAALTRGAAGVAGGASTAYTLGSMGHSGASGVASGMGGVAKAGAQAAISPLKKAVSRSADSLKSSHAGGSKSAFEVTGGASSAGTIGGGAPTPSFTPSGSPDWAKRMKQSQRVSHGASAASHAIRAGDSHGGGSSVSVKSED